MAIARGQVLQGQRQRRRRRRCLHRRRQRHGRGRGNQCDRQWHLGIRQRCQCDCGERHGSRLQCGGKATTARHSAPTRRRVRNTRWQWVPREWRAAIRHGDGCGGLAPWATAAGPRRIERSRRHRVDGRGLRSSALSDGSTGWVRRARLRVIYDTAVGFVPTASGGDRRRWVPRDRQRLHSVAVGGRCWACCRRKRRGTTRRRSAARRCRAPTARRSATSRKPMAQTIARRWAAMRLRRPTTAWRWARARWPIATTASRWAAKTASARSPTWRRAPKTPMR